jgi:hypothetical protein
MPKTNDASGATYYGHEGIVEHAGGAGSTRPGGLSEVDHARNLDGTVIAGYESEEREVEDREGAHPAEPILLPSEDENTPDTEERPLGEREPDKEERQHPGQEKGGERNFFEPNKGAETEKEVPSSRGSSSEESQSSSAKPSKAKNK